MNQRTVYGFNGATKRVHIVVTEDNQFLAVYDCGYLVFGLNGQDYAYGQDYAWRRNAK